MTLCLVKTASLVSSSMFSSPLWLEGNEACPGVHVVSGPITQSCFSSQTIIPEPLPAMHRNYPKCRPSHMLSDPESPLQPNGLLVSQMPSLLSDFELPNFPTVFTTTVLVRSTKNHAILPQNVNVGIIRPQTSQDKATFSDAAETTAFHLANTWHAYACSTQPHLYVPLLRLNLLVPLYVAGKFVINWLKCINLAWILQFYSHFFQSQTLITQTYFLHLVMYIWILTLRSIFKNWLP